MMEGLLDGHDKDKVSEPRLKDCLMAMIKGVVEYNQGNQEYHANQGSDRRRFRQKKANTIIKDLNERI